MVKWFIPILVIVSISAVTLVIAYNASLLRKKEDDSNPKNRRKIGLVTPSPSSFFRVANLPLILFRAITAWGAFRFFDSGSAESNVGKHPSPLFGDLSARRFDDRSLPMPRKGLWDMLFFGRPHDGTGRGTQDFVQLFDGPNPLR